MWSVIFESQPCLLPNMECCCRVNVLFVAQVLLSSQCFLRCSSVVVESMLSLLLKCCCRVNALFVAQVLLSSQRAVYCHMRSVVVESKCYLCNMEWYCLVKAVIAQCRVLSSSQCSLYCSIRSVIIELESCLLPNVECCSRVNTLYCSMQSVFIGVLQWRSCAACLIPHRYVCYSGVAVLCL